MTRTIPSKPRTFHADLSHLPPALLPLTKSRCWVIWRWVEQTNKNGDVRWTKPPLQCAYPKAKAKSNDPRTWGSYEEAMRAFAAGRCDGIGFMLKDSDLGAIDLDHIRNCANGQVLGWAEKLFAEAANAGCYLEWTVSGAGARIIGIARGSKLHKKINLSPNGCAVEFYRHCERYITISGFQISGDYPGLPVSTELPEYDALFDALVARFSDSAQRPTRCEFDGKMVISVESIDEDEFDFNNAGPQQAPDYPDLIENGAPQGERSEEFQRVVWHLAGQGWSAERIAEELAKHPQGISEKYAGRLLTEVMRSFDKWRSQRRTSAVGGSAGAVGAASGAGTATSAGGTAGGAAGVAGTPWPQIRVVPGELPRVVNEAEDALIGLGREIYQRGSVLVRPVLNQSLKTSSGRKTASWQLLPVTRPYLVEQLCCAAQFMRYDKRAKKFVAVDAPDKVAEVYLNRQGRWKLPPLAGVINTPFLRVDGSICETPGYDRTSYLLFKPEGQSFPPVPRYPSKAEADAALGLLRELIKTFPFVSETDRAVALAGMLTALDRRSIEHAPLIGLSAPAARTGKSLLIDLFNILAAGREMPVISQGKKEGEFESRLGACLLAGDACISIDNCEAPVGGALLCQALTQTELDIRVLGYSKNVRTFMNATIFANGNNLEIMGDVSDRTLVASLDAKVERPGQRKFAGDIKRETHARRGELVVAALTVLRAWQVARAQGERLELEPFGGFENWSERVREPLVWLGEPDPYAVVTKVRDNDPQRDQLRVVIMQWKEKLGLNVKYTVQEVIERAIVVSSFYNALLAVAAARGGAVDNARLGRWLKRVESKIVEGCSLIQDGSAHGGYPNWKLIQC